MGLEIKELQQAFNLHVKGGRPSISQVLKGAMSLTEEREAVEIGEIERGRSR